jgi:hypothetical protein
VPFGTASPFKCEGTGIIHRASVALPRGGEILYRLPVRRRQENRIGHNVQKFRRRKNYRRLKGQRQHYASVRVKHILLPGQAAPAATPAQAAPQTQPEAPATPS